MNYQFIYNNIIANALTRDLNKHKLTYYTELHHIIPRSLGGNNDANNLVLLTTKEHYICHHLLYKIYQSKSMLYAYKMMSHFSRYNMKLTEHERNQLGISFSNILKNRKLSNNTKMLLSQSRIHDWNNNIKYRNKMIYKFNSIETRNKRSKSLKQWIENNKDIFSEKMIKINTNIEKIQKTANTHRGMTRSIKAKQNMSESAKGKHIGITNGGWNGYYVTPKGTYELVSDACSINNIKASVLRNRCKYNNKNIIKAQSLRNTDVIRDYIGKTWNELGWGFLEV